MFVIDNQFSQRQTCEEVAKELRGQGIGARSVYVLPMFGDICGADGFSAGRTMPD